MNAPDKIYIDDNVFPTHIDWDGSPINTKRIESGDIEYIRKDALLEWVKEQEEIMKCGGRVLISDIIAKIESL